MSISVYFEYEGLGDALNALENLSKGGKRIAEGIGAAELVASVLREVVYGYDPKGDLVTRLLQRGVDAYAVEQFYDMIREDLTDIFFGRLERSKNLRLDDYHAAVTAISETEYHVDLVHVDEMKNPPTEAEAAMSRLRREISQGERNGDYIPPKLRALL